MNHVVTHKSEGSFAAWMLTIVLAVCAGALISQSPYAAVGLFVFSALVYACARDPLKATCLLVMFFPFSEAMYLSDRLIDLPGAKPVFALGLFAILILLAKRHEADILPKQARNLLLAVLVLFSISILRALPNLSFLNLHFVEELSSARFLMSFYIKPLIYLLPFFAIAKLVKTKDDLQTIINATTIALGVLSLAITYVFTFKAGAVFDPFVVTDTYSEYFGMHRNNLATFYIVGLPVVLFGLNLNRSAIRFAVVAICLFAIAILFSRTAYLTTLLTFFSFSLFMHKNRLISCALFAIIIFTLLFNNFISDRATTGLGEGDANALSAGRIEQIWMPLLQESAQDPLKLLFGSGRYAIAYSDSAQKNRIQFVFHPHNMYLEQLLDIGLVGVIIFWTALIIILSKVFHLARSKEVGFLSSFAKILLISLFCFFVSGLTGRSLFPDLPTSYVWFILGSAAALLKVAENRGLYDSEQRQQ